MEDVPSSPFDRKRRRNVDQKPADGQPVDKKARPTTLASPNSDERSWYPRDSVMGFLGSMTPGRPKYDSDDQSSMVSEPGSEPALSQVSEEDVAMLSSSDDEAEDKPSATAMRGRPILPRTSAERKAATQCNRALTPMMSPKMSNSNLAGHVRARHPQENISSDKADVPSPINEDEILTPPSAAEAAGSQLSMLSVNDVEMSAAADDGDDEDDSEDMPSISVQEHDERSMHLDGSGNPDFNQTPSTLDMTLARKTRARSGALSAGEGSPMRETPGRVDGFSSKRGFSMGYRADCDKCQQKVPGHMNHLF